MQQLHGLFAIAKLLVSFGSNQNHAETVITVLAITEIEAIRLY